MQKVANYISMEYDDCEFHNLTQDEIYTIKMIGNSYYNNFDNICNEYYCGSEFTAST